MPELRNSIRASYKATYNQISSTGIAATNTQPNIKAPRSAAPGPTVRLRRRPLFNPFESHRANSPVSRIGSPTPADPELTRNC